MVRRQFPGSGYTTSHPDFHLPDTVEVGAEFDAKKYAETLKNAQVDVIYFFAKCHYGNSYYYTKVGHRHPGLKTDLLREIVDISHQEGIKVVAYFSGGIDTYAAKQHPDWRPVGKEGLPEPISEDANVLEYICLLGPYTNEWLIPQMAEVARYYEVDGMMTDTMSAFLCYCPHCRSNYLAETGKSLPVDEKAADWTDFCRWRYQKKEEFIDKVCKGVHRVKPELPVAFNWMYSIWDPAPPNKEIGYLVGDIPQAEEQLPFFNLAARYFASTGLPFEVMTGRFLHGLGDWSIKPMDMLKQGMVTVAANGGRCTLIDRQLPDGSFEEKYYQRLKSVFSFIHERKSVFEGAILLKQIAILHTASSLFGPDKELYGSNKRQDKPVEGASMVMSDLSRHYTVTNEFNFEKALSEYETVLLPEQYALSDNTLKIIKDYVVNGGTVLASHRCGFKGENWPLADLFGLESAGEYPYSFCYLLYPTKEEDEYANVPVMIHGKCAKMRVSGCQVLADLYEPMISGRFGWGEAPPKTTPSSPGITINSYGKGKAVYITGPAFTSLRNFYNPAGLYIIRKILATLVPNPLLDVVCEPGVGVSLTGQPGKINVHLINQNGERRINNWSVTQAIRPTGKIQIRLKVDKKPVSVVRIPENENLEFSYNSGVVNCTVSNVHIHTCIQVCTSSATIG